jgi:hypothetical protein
MPLIDLGLVDLAFIVVADEDVDAAFIFLVCCRVITIMVVCLYIFIYIYFISIFRVLCILKIQKIDL